MTMLFGAMATGQGTTQSFFAQPLRVCVASVRNFASRCNGSPDAPQQISKSAPAGGWCPRSVDFCGYDVDVFEAVASSLGLVWGRDYYFVCTGEDSLGALENSLADPANDSLSCDISATFMQVRPARVNEGVRYSVGTFRSYLAALVHAPPRPRGRWSFALPVVGEVWAAALTTILVSLALGGAMQICLRAQPRCDPRSHSVLRVSAKRVFLAANAFLVYLIFCTYTSSLTTMYVLRDNVRAVEDVSQLRGRNVATIEAHASALRDVGMNIRIGRDYVPMVQGVKSGRYAALVAEATQLQALAASDEDCSLAVLQEQILTFETGIAFRKNFSYPAFINAFDDAFLNLQNEGSLMVIEERYRVARSQCNENALTRVSAVQLHSLLGLWVILGCSILGACFLGIAQYALCRMLKPCEAKRIQSRVFEIMRLPLPPACPRLYSPEDRS